MHGAGQEVDLVLALEGYEGLRHLPYLTPHGLALVNREFVALNGAVSGAADLAEKDDPRLLWLDGSRASERWWFA